MTEEERDLLLTVAVAIADYHANAGRFNDSNIVRRMVERARDARRAERASPPRAASDEEG